MAEAFDAVIVGAGPAGLMVASELSARGCRVLVAEAKPSVARKFLMAGKSGLNLTKDEPIDALLPHYEEAADWLAPMLQEFDAQAVQDWARGLGQEIFSGSTGRVFPKVMKAWPLLRAWLAELDDKGVEIRTRWRWTGWAGEALRFDTPEGLVEVEAKATVLAMGGASWARLGSDGAWSEALAVRGVEMTPFAPANAGLLVNWSTHMAPLFGAPIKGVALHCAGRVSRGGGGDL